MAKETKKKELFIGTGRRKTASASVFLEDKKGDFTVNGKDVEQYFPTEKEQTKWLKPFHAVGLSHPKSRFSISARIKGSGKQSQLGALIHGLARALSELSAEYAVMLRKQGLLTRDSRMVERKKPFLHKARKAPQYSKR